MADFGFCAVPSSQRKKHIPFYICAFGDIFTELPTQNEFIQKITLTHGIYV